MSEEEFGGWTIIFSHKMPITISKKDALTLRDVAVWLKEHGYQPWEIVGVLRSVSIIQGKLAARTVRKMMELMKP